MKVGGFKDPLYIQLSPLAHQHSTSLLIARLLRATHLPRTKYLGFRVKAFYATLYYYPSLSALSPPQERPI